MGKDDRKKVFFLNFFRPKVFDMYFPKKVFNGVFELPLLRNAQKRTKTHKNAHKKKKYLPTPFSGHLPDIRGFQFYFSWAPLVPFFGVFVFLGSSCRETAKNAIKKNRWEKTTGKKFFFLNFFRPKVFDMYFPKKVFCGVFELPLLRNAQKRHKKNLKN